MSEQTKKANPDRIDFAIVTDGVAVTKFDKVGDRSIPREAGCEIKDWGKDELDEALTWCKNNGYIVREWSVNGWSNGARAFKGELYAIRSEGQLKRMRRQLSSRGVGFFYDLRYDL